MGAELLVQAEPEPAVPHPLQKMRDTAGVEEF